MIEKIRFEATTIQAKGTGPSSRGPGALRGIRTSSPYADPLINQNPIDGKRLIERHIAEQKSSKMEEAFISAVIDPQIAATTEIGTMTL
tara:strand:- start:7370 stop:7636 length:267 start_codon:yes stop_codon:yes gene_type:complete